MCMHTNCNFYPIKYNNNTGESMIKCIYASSASLCLEWQNNLPYYAKKEYVVTLNGKEYGTFDTNVFSLFDLAPNTTYDIAIKGTDVSLQVATLAETNCFSIEQFGAVGDGITDNTVAIQTAINCLPSGGRLVVPEGTFVTAPLCLKSNITLELKKGATLLAHTDKQRYPLVPGEIADLVTGEAVQVGTWEGNPATMHQAFIFGEHLSNVNIIGQGTIDGNAQNVGWWIDVKNQPNARPRLVFFNKSSNVTIHGITGQNSGAWQFHPYFCNNVRFLNLYINAPKDSPNTDGIDPEACDHVDIIGCKFSVGDDCIAIKSGKMYIGQKYKTPANHHTIRNCLMQFGHGAVTLGSEMAGGVKNLMVDRCVFYATDRGLRIKTRRGRGKLAVIDGVTFENILMDHVMTPIVINMWYNCCDPDRYSEYNTTREKLPVDDRTPYLGEFCFKDMVCKNCHVAAVYCDGLPEQPIKKIHLSNIQFTYALDAQSGVPSMKNNSVKLCKSGLYFENVKQLIIKNVTLDGVVGQRIVANNVDDLTEE